jgi:hypothetical protein
MVSKPWLAAFAAISNAGLVLSIATNLAAWRRTGGPLGVYDFCLHIGFVMVWIPIIRLVEGVPREDHWKVLLRGAPRWVRDGMRCLFGYAILCFVLMSTQPKAAFTSPVSFEVDRGFSAGWIAMYFAELVILCLAINRIEDDS